MSDAPAKPDFRHTVFLPKTDFPMKAGLPQKEPAILARWLEQDLYGELRKARAGRTKFILHDGPPYANGDIHIGHALNHTLKDMVVRTQTLLGKDAPYVPGWDCHGLPIEWKIEEQYRKKKLDKDQVPLLEFRAECRAYAQHWVDTQREQLKRLGIGGDWDHPYLTMDFDAEATIVAELMKFAESGQLYRGAKPVMWSPVEKTALAEAEIEYEDITSTQIDVAFRITEAPNSPAIAKVREWCEVDAVVWTTTPWTIPVNQALAFRRDIEYSIINLIWRPSSIGGCYLVATDLVESFVARLRANPNAHSDADISVDVSVCGTLLGHELDGATASHPYVDAPHRNATNDEGDWREDWVRAFAFFQRPRPFLPGEFVTTDQGTGLVHMAPDHGVDDFELCKSVGIEPVFAVEGDGKYRADWAWLGGHGSVINTKFNAPDGPICSDLREAGALLAASADFQHSYPHSWRSKAKVIYRCTPQWFIAMDRAICPSPLEGEGGAALAAEGEGLSPSPQPSPSRGEGATLRQTALQAIADTRFVPEKGRNRL